MARPRLILPPLPAAPRRAWLVAILACVLLFLFTNKSRETACIHNVVIYDTIILPHNCDALSMEDKLFQLQTFYTTFHNWKGRPVYHAYGAVVGSALVPIAFPLWAMLYPGARAKDYLKEFGRSFNFQLAYFLLNIGVVIACAWIAIRVGDLPTASWPAVALAGAVASTDLVEGGVWLLHTNIFNLLAAFGTLLFTVLGMQRTLITRAAVLWGGFAIGLGILIYPAMAILAPGYAAGRVIGRLRVANDRASLPGEALEFMFFATAAALPVLVWWSSNRFIFGTDTYLTADKGQFSWVPQAWAAGKLFSILGPRIAIYARGVVGHSAAEYTMALASIALLTLWRGRDGMRSLVVDPVVWAVLIAMAGVLGFNFLQGYSAARLQVSAAYLLYVVVARLARTQRTETLGTLCLVAIAAYQIGNAITTYSVTGD